VAGRQIKFALVGCGYIGKRYINLLSQHPQCQLTAIVDTDDHVFSAHQYSNISFFNSLGLFLNSDINTDAAIVATPNGTHAAIAIELLKQNKHVLIEKPMALEKKEAEMVIQTAHQHNKKLAVVLQNRFSPVSLWLKDLVESKRLGKIFLVEVNCFWNRDERYYKKNSWHGTKAMDGGSLFTQFSHFVDTIYWLFGNIKNINSRFYNFNHQQLTQFEDTGCIHFEFEAGGFGSINFSTAVWDKSFETSLTILAEKGSIKISGQYMDRIEHCHINGYDLPVQNNSSPMNNHYKMVDAFCEAVIENKSTNAQDALHSVDMIERMYISQNLPA
jgi:predicted dehydrogenase